MRDWYGFCENTRNQTNEIQINQTYGNKKLSLTFAVSANGSDAKPNTDLVAVADEIAPAVVSIASVLLIQEPDAGASGSTLPGRFGQSMRPRGLGSGVILDQEGHILTNAHVVANTSKLRVRLADDREFQATLVGMDRPTDIAVLKIKPGDEELPVAQLGSDADVTSGNRVLAIGSPYGLERTITDGIVSATGRAGLGISAQENFIQTDAAINPGNSGGPLVSYTGKFIGINTAAFGQQGGNTGIGFAIPIDTAKNVMTAILETGYVTRNWLGLDLQNLTPPLAETLGIKKSDGILVTNVVDKMPGEKAGIRRDDIIVRAGGQKTPDSARLRQAIAGKKPGEELKLSLVRQNKQKTVTVAVEPFLEPTQQTRAMRQQLGFVVRDLSPKIRDRFHMV